MPDRSICCLCLYYVRTCNYKGSKLGHAWVIFQPHFKEMTNEGRCVIWHGLQHNICVKLNLNYPSAHIQFQICSYIASYGTLKQMPPKNLIWFCLSDHKKYQFLKGHNSVNSCPILKMFSFLWSRAKDFSFCQVLLKSERMS